MALIYTSAYFIIIILDGKDVNYNLEELVSNIEY
jgi:hypothetical protein